MWHTITLKKMSLLLAAMLMLSMAACSDSDSDADEEANKAPETAENLYLTARQQFADREYKTAVKSFEEVERQHPSSKWAVNAQIMSAYASYKEGEYDDAIATLERFVKLYPNHESAPYAYYMIANCYYEQIADVGRDQRVTEQAMQALREVIRRFPDSEYARDARIKLDLTQDHLAGKEMQVGRYYQRHDDILAAINRYRFVVENFQTTSHIPEALHRLVECYLKLGVVEEAKRYASVLGYNFPNSIWYRDSYALLNGGAKPVDWEEADDGTQAQSDDRLMQPPGADEDGVIRRDAVAAPVEGVSSSPEGTSTSAEEDQSIWDSIIPW